EVKDYKHIDMVNKGSDVKKGFIAQQVEKVFPQAVSKTSDFIPNVYKMAESVAYDASGKTLKVTVKETPDLKVGDTVRLISDANYEKEIVAVNGRSFTVKDWDKETKGVFVFGKEVDDFRNLDYDCIFTLGVSAVQELSKQVKEQNEEIEALKKKVAELENK
ncbi:MAG: tail fiber domain-containing protein, partial [Candidatus Margulisbacteria bacterium]|nr:tail fiber domain-containing protein [Candidatus Margulisiibacteriota bacterium]